MSASVVVTDPETIKVLKQHDRWSRPSKKVCLIRVHPTQERSEGKPGVLVNCACGNFWDQQCCTPPCAMHGCGPRKGCKCPLPQEQNDAPATVPEMLGGGAE